MAIRWASRMALAALVGLAILAAFQPTGGLWPTRGAKGINQPGLLYWAGSATAKRVALTFDDGPRDPFTGEILDILKARDVKATFFLVGRNVEQYPELAQRIEREGHAIGNHSLSHSDAALLFKRSAQREIVRAQETIERVTGARPYLFRPPHGRWNDGLLRLARTHGLLTIKWSVCPRDWLRPSPNEIVQRVMSKVQNGSIILLHDGHPPLNPGDRHNTVLALPTLIAEIRARGYELVTVPELLNLDPLDERVEARLSRD